ncbi:MAG TPA: NAD(P) transhydrogenase subunit alpha [Acholeplasmataceae bacterium]|mgnify:CR=1 FL=1|jgi:NAD(P) transhydrogenase subunit alpha|nr:NAD(P) transhydrogenase subunit alpha [Acholeplasmataceae bacterium]
MGLELTLIGIFIVSTIVGYFLINNVPPLLHTPLMSGMNALSGITLIGALIATAIGLKESNPIISAILGGIAIVVATINVVGGFGITDKMLKMFKKKVKQDE